jgi:hypothetical protein
MGAPQNDGRRVHFARRNVRLKRLEGGSAGHHRGVDQMNGSADCKLDEYTISVLIN